MFTDLPGPEGSVEKAARASNRPTAVVAGSPSPARISCAPSRNSRTITRAKCAEAPKFCVLVWTRNGLVCRYQNSSL